MKKLLLSCLLIANLCYADDVYVSSAYTCTQPGDPSSCYSEVASAVPLIIQSYPITWIPGEYLFSTCNYNPNLYTLNCEYNSRESMGKIYSIMGQHLSNVIPDIHGFNSHWIDEGQGFASCSVIGAQSNLCPLIQLSK